MLNYYSPPSDWAKVHKLREPISSLKSGSKGVTVCGFPVRNGHYAAGWESFPETHSAFCKRCRAAV